MYEMWLHATRAGPSRGTCSRPSKRQLNHSLIGGTRTLSASRYQGSRAGLRSEKSIVPSPGSAPKPAVTTLPRPVAGLDQAVPHRQDAVDVLQELLAVRGYQARRARPGGFPERAEHLAG